MKRRKTMQVYVGGVGIGSDFPVRVQSMTKTDTINYKKVITEIKKLEDIGCELIRVGVQNKSAIVPFRKIVAAVKIPVIADIHFSHDLALTSFDSGAACVRVNPGNLGSIENFKKVIDKAKEVRGAIRVGVNSGSIDKMVLKKYGHPTADAMVDSARKYIDILKEMRFDNYKVSLKSTSVIETVAAYKNLSKFTDAPFHIGITEAGPLFSGSIHSAVGVAILLWEGLGDTLRVSLSSDAADEINVAYQILRALHLRNVGVRVISCPTCTRTTIDVRGVAGKIEKAVSKIMSPLTIAIMGCSVNGPGEAKEADIGIAGGKNKSFLFKKGKIVKKIETNKIIDILVKELKGII